MKRDPFGKVSLVALLIVAGGLVAVTRAPDAWWVERLTRAVVIGPWIERLAELYRRPESVAASSDLEGGVEVIYRIDPSQREARATILVNDGTPLYREASEGSDRLATLSRDTVELFDRRGDWYLIEHEGSKGWVFLPAERVAEDRAPPLGSDPAPPLPLPSRPPDPEVLAAALELLGEGQEKKALGAYTLYTDVRDRGLLIFLSAIAAQLESVYESRYGLTPRPGALEAVVLFASARDFSEFLVGAGQHVDPSAPGIFLSGVVATHSEGRGWSEVASTLVHEMSHLFNKRALGPALPPWLEEGLADDLAQSRIEGLRIFPGTLGGSEVRTGGRIVYRGALAALLELERATSRDELPSLETLLALDWEDFQDSDRRSQHYGQSSFFVRSLLDSPEAGLATSFRLFLHEVSEGGPVSGEALLAKLGRSWQSLDSQLAAFVERQAEAEGLPVSTARGSSSRQAREPSS